MATTNIVEIHLHIDDIKYWNSSSFFHTMYDKYEYVTFATHK